MIKVPIGDGHRIVREGPKQVLADAPDVCALAETLAGSDGRPNWCTTQTSTPYRAQLGGTGGLNCAVFSRVMQCWPYTAPSR